MMMMKKCCTPGLGLLLIRLGVGIVFLLHGVGKLTNMDATIGFFGSLGLGIAFAYIVTAVEVLGGIAMILGFATSIAGILLAITMIVAIALVKIHLPFLASEIDIMLLVSSLGIAFAGPGKWALTPNGCGCGGKSCPVCSTGCDNCEECKGGMCTGHETK